jgi:cytochrome P450 family 135
MDRLPPGPRAHHLRQQLAWFRRPVRFMEDGRRRYGPVFAARFGPAQRAVFVADPDAVREIVRGDPAVLRMGDANGLFRPVVGSSSILVLDGDEHLRHRRLMLPAFRRNHVAKFERVIIDAVERRAEDWPAGGRFPLQPEMEAIAFTTITEMALGTASGERVARLRELFERMMDLCESPFTLLPEFRREAGGFSPYGRLMRVLAELDEIVYAEIAERRRRRAEDRGEDLLSLLVAAEGADGTPMTDREIRDELVTMLMAGQETTTSALSWAFERLARHPAVAERLAREIDGGDEEYLDAVIKEVLRQRPPIPVMVRKLRAHQRVGGYDCPSGWVLMPSIYLVHREPSVYPEPEAFRPERFLENPPPGHAWIPFGGGARRCLGANLAEFELRVVLRTVIPRLRLEPTTAPAEPIRRQRFAFSPRHGAAVAFANGWRDAEERTPELPARMPPGPRAPAVVQTARFVRDPVEFFERCRDRYGPAVTADLLGFGRTVWITDPKLVRRVLASPDDLRAGAAANVAEPIFGRHSVVTSDGTEHAERRKRLLPPLRSNHVAPFAAMFAQAAEREVADWRAGTTIELLPALYRITMDVVLRTVLGIRSAEEQRRYADAIHAVAAMGNVAALGPAFRVDAGRLSPGGRFARRLRHLDGLIYELIGAARDGDRADHDDILSMLAHARREDGTRLEDVEIRDELVGLVIAGQETTGTALAWTFDLLLRNPAAHARVIAEAALERSEYTDAAIKEALRVRPPVIAAARIAHEDIELGEWRIPAGTRVWAPMTLVQRDGDSFEGPDRFDPERFLRGKPPAMSWIPFGGGNRRCVGASFAMLEMRIVLQLVLSRAWLRPSSQPEAPRLNNVIMEPSRGMRVRYDGRREPADQDWARKVLRIAPGSGECEVSPARVRTLRSAGARDRAPAEAHRPPRDRTGSPR